jgi:DNA polymerase-1
MQPRIDFPRALLRGRYTAAVARMEWNGVPIDTEAFGRLREGWGSIQDALIEQVDGMYGVFRGRDFNPRLWAAWLNRNAIPWPRLAAGRLDLSLDTFKKMAEVFPEVRPMHELRASLSWLRPLRLSVGSDGRNRCPLRPFASKTGRNQPSTSRFIFGPATWLRGLIKPGEGMALAYVDYEQQEFGIAAALSGDPAMQEAYRSGDPYLAFAKQAGAVPRDATKQTHRHERERFKQCALGVQYGMGAKSLAVRLGASVDQGRDLLRLHRRTYPRYWRWSNEVERRTHADGKLQAAFGWTVHVGQDANPRSLRNFPLQANGAEMLRLACCFLTEAGVCVCAPVHDALLVEAPAEDIDEVVAACEQEMYRASEYVLAGFPLRTEAKVVRFPERYMDPRGEAMWGTVFGLLDREGIVRCA